MPVASGQSKMANNCHARQPGWRLKSRLDGGLRAAAKLGYACRLRGLES
jgi:hypothetical protein